MKIKVIQKGDLHKTYDFLKHGAEPKLDIIEKYAREGVNALSSATPIKTGKTSSSWRYEITRTKNTIVIQWLNDNVINGVNIAVILQYGHGTRNGGYVKGFDYINPSLRPIFDNIAKNVWKEVTK